MQEKIHLFKLNNKGFGISLQKFANNCSMRMKMFNNCKKIKEQNCEHHQHSPKRSGQLENLI